MSTKLSHTPGPWSYYGHSAYTEGEIIHEHSGYLLASLAWCSDSLEETFGNGTLMAAAPEMLEALETAYELLESCEYAEAMLFIKAAIAKAKNETL